MIPLPTNAYELPGAFYLGLDKRTQSPLLIGADSLMTHGVILGQTGSGKTGLALALLEEAAIDGYPAIIIDPKGDLGNLLLQFPNLSAEEFAPWTDDPEGESAKWIDGLANWGQTEARIQKMLEVTDLQIYTPGSTKGRPLAVIRQINPPGTDHPDDRNRALVSEVQSLLDFAGVKGGASGPEGLLVSELIAWAWDQGSAITIEQIIRKIHKPPCATIGVLTVDEVCPERRRRELSVKLNSLIANPALQAWREGAPLDIDTLVRAPDGRPRMSVLSIAHLNDEQRMFFVTKVLNELVNWMRRQPGSRELKTLLYIDEIFGLMPPVKNPPSKEPLLLLLKQARAFGLGVVLASQNPIDLDYRALSNIGTWFLGRLQTERDVARVADGMQAAASERGESLEIGALKRKLAGLDKRHFLAMGPGIDGYTTLESRWCLSYLRGPLTLEETASLCPETEEPRTDDVPELVEMDAVVEQAPVESFLITSDDGGMEFDGITEELSKISEDMDREMKEACDIAPGSIRGPGCLKCGGNIRQGLGGPSVLGGFCLCILSLVMPTPLNVIGILLGLKKMIVPYQLYTCTGCGWSGTKLPVPLTLGRVVGVVGLAFFTILVWLYVMGSK